MRQMDNNKWMGIDNIHSSLEMQQLYAGRDGTKKFLVNATNIDISDGGDVYSRQGTVQRVAGKHEGGFGFANRLFCVRSGELRAYDTGNWSYVTIGSVVGSEIGRAVVGDELYLSDGVSKWKVSSNMSVSTWGSGGGDTSFDAERVVPFPPCTKLAYQNGRLYGVIDNAVIYSEPYRYDLFDPTKNFYQFGAAVTMLHANKEILVVSAEETYVITSPGTSEAALQPAFPFPSPSCTPAIDPDTKTAYWMTERGWVSLKESDNMPSALTLSTVCSRRPQSSVVGIVKRAGVTAVVAVSTPDSAYPSANPLMSSDFVESEANRIEV